MKSIRMKLITYFLVVILCVCLITGVVVTATTKSVLKNNIELTSSQTVTETLKGFQTYLRTMLKAKPTTKLNRYVGTNFFLIIIRLKISVP